MAMILPAPLSSQTLGVAMLHAPAGVRLNGNPAPASAAIFPDDWLETPDGAEAKIDVGGSTAVLAPNTRLQFEGNELFLEHGTVQVTTSAQMTVRAGCITAIPVVTAWTQYEVTDVDGKVTVAAHKSDMNIDRRKTDRRKSKTDAPTKTDATPSERVTVREGEQATREEHCVVAIRPPEYVAGKAALLNTWEAKVAGLVAVGVVACLGLCRCSDPMSPSDPSPCH